MNKRLPCSRRLKIFVLIPGALVAAFGHTLFIRNYGTENDAALPLVFQHDKRL
ncbi:hypothetical protein [Sulfuriferula multivorans]|uniref:hypothetical protein n=1 Tax=Sulfuriferula multivorans TaxID=1559896 RepID=UPI00167245FC|nr:hypothetical protein [Sulfuriferula multivorans]